MNRLRTWCKSVIVLLASAGCVWAQEPVGGEASAAGVRAVVGDPLEVGRTYTGWLYDGEVARLWGVFSDELRQGLGGDASALRAFRDQVAAQLGGEAEVLSEHAADLGGDRGYVRTARFEGFDGAVVVAWMFDDAGTVTAFYVRPRQAEASSAYEDYRTRAELRLPFTGEWTVFWGGRVVEQNDHAAYPDQRFAYDLVVVEDGRRYVGDGTRNADYRCFGRPILAPAAGVVVVARDGVHDNVPGEMNPAVPPGNHVVLDHGTGEYSFLAHLREGSVRVAEGDRVEAGAVLGECGNSGNSSEPHLHYHLQTTPDFGAGEGLPTQFRDYIADGVPIERGEPVRGQRIRPR